MDEKKITTTTKSKITEIDGYVVGGIIRWARSFRCTFWSQNIDFKLILILYWSKKQVRIHCARVREREREETWRVEFLGNKVSRDTLPAWTRLNWISPFAICIHVIHSKRIDIECYYWWIRILFQRYFCLLFVPYCRLFSIMVGSIPQFEPTSHQLQIN